MPFIFIHFSHFFFSSVYCLSIQWLFLGYLCAFFILSIAKQQHEESHEEPFFVMITVNKPKKKTQRILFRVENSVLYSIASNCNRWAKHITEATEMNKMRQVKMVAASN